MQKERLYLFFFFPPHAPVVLPFSVTTVHWNMFLMFLYLSGSIMLLTDKAYRHSTLSSCLQKAPMIRQSCRLTLYRLLVVISLCRHCSSWAGHFVVWMRDIFLRYCLSSNFKEGLRLREVSWLGAFQTQLNCRKCFGCFIVVVLSLCCTSQSGEVWWACTVVHSATFEYVQCKNRSVTHAHTETHTHRHYRLMCILQHAYHRLFRLFK